MVKPVNVDEFLALGKQFTIIDVRTPAEFEKGHIPGAVNIPLFTNDERVVVGTLYKQEGRQPAILKGLELVGPKLSTIAAEGEKLAKENTVLVHCWRGGMRSGSVAWLLNTYGLNVYTLKGGYKFFRRRILESFEAKYRMHVIGGKTGSSKSKVIVWLKEKNVQCIDLEAMANHKGSSYGHLGEAAQPSQEMFENLLGFALLNCDASKKILFEDESRKVGKKIIPAGIWDQLRSSHVVYLDVDFEKRAQYLASEYGKFDPDDLIEATKRIERRLGPLETKTACAAISENRMLDACRIILHYYDKTYDYGLSQRDQSLIQHVPIDQYDEKTLDKLAALILA
ncbi:MAG TPA: tRNA 2-selenouridine(34) synthase MnmH [Flavobacteriales bacterium]|nr:tRNA 2-selenouridine(34) synthase MnmH [Flavobacteriales bacterium]